MSYSRWGPGSYWYTYFSVSDSETRAGQVFMVCGVRGFTYEDLQKDIDACLQKCKEECELSEEKAPELLKELRGYMLEFMDDVINDKEIDEMEEVNAASLMDLPLLLPNLKYERSREILARRLTDG